VVTNPKEMELFYKASVANGLTGWNYYMFSQGRNQPRKGYSGETFYWFTPLSAEGEPAGAYPLVTRMNRIVRTAEKEIVNATRRAAVGVLFYPPYYTTELERPADERCNLTFVPSAIRRPAYFDGLLKVLQFLNVDYEMIDLTRTDAGQLAAYPQVWTLTTDEMDAASQQTLVDYAFSGGRLILFPFLPDRNLNQQPCTIIRDALNICPSGKETIDSPLIDIYGFKDIKCANPLIIYDEKNLGEAVVIARTLEGSCCGFEKKTGRGSLIHMGTWMGFDTEGHLPVYKKLLDQQDVELCHASADNPFMILRERFTEQESAPVR
jgi:beta-galactosidase